MYLLDTLGAASEQYTFILKSYLSHHFRATLQLPNWPGNRARELFKPSKDAASLVLGFKKILKSFRFQVSCGWCNKWGRFWHFWPGLL